jgi:transcriptional regulator with XRE-family HTH domain
VRSGLRIQIGNTVKGLRKDLGIKQTRLASALKISQSCYCRHEKGITPFNLDQLEALSNELGIRVSDLITRAEKSL